LREEAKVSNTSTRKSIPLRGSAVFFPPDSRDFAVPGVAHVPPIGWGKLARGEASE
jgi:hypothetical protein